MNKKDLNIAKRYAETIKKNGINLKSLYVFGSRVMGTSKKWSDLDTCVVSNDFGKDRVFERVKLMCLGRTISLLIEPHPFSEKEFENKENMLAQQIQKTGIKIV
ncbi:nucleotidyltransferase domain-containing protein [Patescibacteria group bacterium]|nr:nucleotidyltransferase domain-containing protein [Patescibacteria group bacterium]MBU1885338.1 nucleotidyltransferase domain-containing protein [Patescibacteria group bacterium]